MERSAASQKSHIFLDKTALQDTGQYGWQRFRKPLLYKKAANQNFGAQNKRGRSDSILIVGASW
jgi:hypothetical protein